MQFPCLLPSRGAAGHTVPMLSMPDFGARRLAYSLGLHDCSVHMCVTYPNTTVVTHALSGHIFCMGTKRALIATLYARLHMGCPVKFPY